MSSDVGERKARFEQLFAETRADLLRYALRRTDSAESAADVLSETFLIAWRKLDSIPPGDSARLWLYGVARNVLRRDLKRTRGLEAANERLAWELRRAFPLVGVRDKELSPQLLLGIKALPATQREVILLAAWEDLNPRDISIVVGVPVNLVRVRLHRARARLRQHLASTTASPASAESETALELCSLAERGL